MRNLQKILALALALIMSFSLVVTANAAFSDEADINETYNESVNVLAQLEVFRGYTDGSYKPQDSITRAEVAAIIYRIATGDVSDSQVSLYSDWNRFKDVASGSWYAGYVNYCANAEYIKGYEDGSFRPNNNVTGYEALAMILRAVGYGKMDEFVGSNWAVNTAARANTLKISKNVTAALLGSPASREVVAELLFRSILVPTVTYNNAFGYQETDTTLGYDSFKLEQIEGVVVANEFANLYDTQVLGAGKTDFEIAKDDVRSLNIASELTAVGESHYAYVSGSTVYALENTGDNTVWEPENGKGTKVSDGLKAASLKKNDDTEYYINFGREGHFSCDQRLEFQVVFYDYHALASFDTYEDISKVAAENEKDWTVKYGWDEANGEEPKDGTLATVNADKTGFNQFDDKSNNNYPIVFNRIIRADEEITNEEMDILRGIFAAADNDWENGKDRDKFTGDVFVGTKSTNSATDEERDVSNTMSFRKFKDEYINSEAWDQDVDKSDNGEWLKIVDNDGDGVAEYVFLTEYTLDKAVSSYTKSGETVLEFNSMDIEYIKDNDGIVDYKDEVAVGDVVYYTEIDNRFTITKAPVVKATIKTVNFKDESCTTTEDATYTESGIENESRLDQEVENLDDKVEYNLYFDAYGWLRAYELAQGNTYGLVTELYKTTHKNEQYVKGEDLTVELKKGSAKIDEFDVENSSNPFLLDVYKAGYGDIDNWAELHDEVWTGYDNHATILLQPAIGQLDKEWDTEDNNASRIFHHSNKGTADTSYATTNVAVYTETADGEVRLTSPVKLAKNVIGKQMYYTNGDLRGEKTTDKTVGWEAYEVDYIALDLSAGVKADAKHYPIHSDSRYAKQSAGRYENYVDAVHDTEFYVVNTDTKKNIDYFTDYEKVYAIGAENIVAAYAVARNVETDFAENDYWVADVIVIEVDGVPTIFDSVGLLYNNPSQTSGSVKRVESYNSESENPRIDMILDSGSFDWAPRYNGSWVYEIDEDKIEDGDLYANKAVEIEKDYNAKGIYAGIVSRVVEVNTRGGYIDVVIPGTADLARADGDLVPAKTDSISVTNDELFAITSKDGGDNIQTNTRSLRMTKSAKDDRLEDDHRILWVEDKDGHVAFVIDVDFVDGSQKTPNWLGDSTTASLWFAVAKEQVDKQNAVTFDDALKAYNEWVANHTEATKKAAVDAIKAALANNTSTKPTAKQVEQLNEMLKNLGGTTTDTNSLVDAYNAWNKANLDHASNEPALRQALYKAALAHTKGDGTSLADQAYDGAVAQAVADVKDFNNKLSDVKFENIKEAADVGLTEDALKLANTHGSGDNDKGSGKEAVKIYNAASGPKAKYEKYAPLYTKALDLVTAYNAYVRGGLGADKTEVRKAFAAIKDTEHLTINTDVKDESSWTFGVAGGATYHAAYEAVGGEIADETAVGTIETVNLNKDLAAKYGATMEELDSSASGVKYVIKMTDRNGMPAINQASGKADIVELVGWLGLTLSDATEKNIDGLGSVTLYRLSGNGFVGEGLTRVATEWMANSSGAGVYGLTLDVYGSDTTMDYQVRVVFEYTGSTAPDSYEYTAEIKNASGKKAEVIVTKVGGEFAAKTDVTSAKIMRVAQISGGDDSLVENVTDSSISLVDSDKTIKVESSALDTLGLKKGDNIYAVITIAGVNEPIVTETIIYAETN